MNDALRASQRIDIINDRFTEGAKSALLTQVPKLSTEILEWLVMEHYQFSFANVELLTVAMDSTARLANQGVTIELKRNIDEEDGHAPMYRQGMRIVGTDVDEREEFPPTTTFLQRVRELSGPDPSRALGALYATETAAIFEHQTFYVICKEICDRRGITYDGTLIKEFHDLHLDGGVEQGHKDGLAAFVDHQEPEDVGGPGERIDNAAVEKGALEAIEAMEIWWKALLDTVASKSSVAAGAN